MSYTFRWERPASEVYVTGTFDNWSKSVKLDHDGESFSKNVPLPSSQEKIYYKFVVDGEWCTSDAKSEADPEGNINNYLNPGDLKEADESTSTRHISSVAPGASTTKMAGEQPLVEHKTQPAPGAFPETPANEEQSFSVDPIPGSEGMGNPAPGSVNTNTIDSGVHDDPELKSKDEANNQTFGVAPIPASGGLGNPIQLAPGEKVPDSSEITSNTVESTARTDEVSYESSGAGIQPVQPNPQSDPVAAGLGPQTSSQIPESSMGMGKDAPADISKEDTGPMMSSVAPTSTTAALAGQVPKEERREPTVINDDNENANISSVAPGSSTAAMAGQVPLEERKEPTVIKDDNENANISSVAPSSTTAGMAGEVPKEERKEPTVVDEDKAKSDESENKGFTGTLAASAAAGGAAVAGGAYAANEMAKDKTGTDPKSSLPESAQKTINNAPLQSTTSTASIPQQTAAGEAPHVPKDDNKLSAVPSVPEEVTTSQKEAGFAPEAAANSEAVDEKKEVEAELLKKVPETEVTGEPAPTASAATATTAPVATADTTSSSGAPQLGDPTAGVAALSMDDKSKTTPAEDPTATEPPAETNKLATPQDEQKPLDSRDVSPMSKSPTKQTEPQVTSGISTTAAPKESTPTPRPAKNTENSTPQKRQSIVDRMKGTPGSSKSAAGESASDSKKEKRKSFFGRIKEKLKN